MHETLARLAPLPELPEPASDNREEPVEETAPTPPPMEWFETDPDKFGIFKRYPRIPMRDLDNEEDPDDHVDAPTIGPKTVLSADYTNPLHAFTQGISHVFQKTKA